MFSIPTSLILAASSQSYSGSNGNQESIFSFKLNKKSLLELACENYDFGNSLLVRKVDSATDAPSNFKGKTVYVGNTRGALISALIALKDCHLEAPLFISPGDALISPELMKRFRISASKSETDISAIVFPSSNPNYSYMRLSDGKLVEVTEKLIISSNATAGIFYFSTAQIFIDCAEWAITNNVVTNGNYYLAPSLNYAVINGLKVQLHQITESDYFRFSTEKEAIESRERWQIEGK